MEKELTLIKFRNDIQGLRGLAVILVIINHFNKLILPSGYLGVDIFFVISGYVITGSIIKNNLNSSVSKLRDFFGKRIARILPSLLIYLIIIGLLIAILNPYPERSLKTGFFAIFGISNLFLFRTSTAYFGDSALINPFTQTWSLGIEEQYYLVYPFLIFIFCKNNKNSIDIKKLQNILLFFISISLFSFIFFYQQNFDAVYYLTVFRVWELSVGCFVFLKREYLSKFISFNRNLLVIFIILICFLPIEYGLYATILVCFLSAILVCPNHSQNEKFNILNNKFLIFIGTISYSLYLWHWGVISISKWILPFNLISIIFELILIFSISFINYKYIESRFRNFILSLKNIKKFLLSISLLSITAFTLTVIGQIKDKIFISNFTGEFKKKSFENVSQELTCEMASNNPTRNWEKCVTKTSENSIFIFGDSHSTNLLPSIKKSIEQLKPNLEVLYFSNSQKYKIPFFENNNPIYDKFLSSLSFGDIIIYSHTMVRSEDENNRFSKELNKIVKTVPDYIPILLIDDLVSPCSELDYRRRFTFGTSECRLSKIEAIEKRSKYTKRLKEYALKENIHYFDPLNAVCESDGFCYATKNSKLLYSDFSPHISIDSKFVLTQFFNNIFSKNNFLDK